MTKHITRIAGLLLVAAVIAGCGGGGGGGYFPPVAGGGTTPPDTTTPAPSALDNFVSYVKSLVASAVDTAEPADVTAFDPPPTSDTTEPTATQ